jgi:hypothetical protein
MISQSSDDSDLCLCFIFIIIIMKWTKLWAFWKTYNQEEKNWKNKYRHFFEWMTTLLTFKAIWERSARVQKGWISGFRLLSILYSIPFLSNFLFVGSFYLSLYLKRLIGRLFSMHSSGNNVFCMPNQCFSILHNAWFWGEIPC